MNCYFPCIAFGMAKDGHILDQHSWHLTTAVLTDDNRHPEELADIQGAHNPLVQIQVWPCRFRHVFIVSFINNRISCQK